MASFSGDDSPLHELAQTVNKDKKKWTDIFREKRREL